MITLRKLYRALYSEEKYIQWALTICGAVAIFLGQPNTFLHLPGAMLAVPACLLLLCFYSSSCKQAVLFGWALGLLGIIPTVYWIIFPLHNVGGLPYPFTLPFVLLLAGYISSYMALTVYIMYSCHMICIRSSKTPGFFRYFFTALLCGICYAGVEILCGFLFTGFPWITLAGAFAFDPIWIQAAAYTGAYGLTACYAIGACSIATALTADTKKGIVLFLIGCTVITSLPLFGLYRLADAPVAEDMSQPVRMALIQGNIDQNQKWDENNVPIIIAHYIKASQAAIHQAKQKYNVPLDMVVWPETSMPFAFQLEDTFARQLRLFSMQNQVHLGFGTMGFSYGKDIYTHHLYNRFHVISPSGNDAGYYDKQHLVPFGEYVPLAMEFALLEKILQGVDFTPGRKNSPIFLPKKNPLEDVQLPPLINGEPQVVNPEETFTSTLALGVLICYEAIFSDIAHDRVSSGATVFLVVSNDAWFGHSAAPLQHLGLSILRTVEYARPMIRCTNTGISALINPYGQIVTSGKLFAEETFLIETYPVSEKTVFYYLRLFIDALLAGITLLMASAHYLYKKYVGNHATTS